MTQHVLYVIGQLTVGGIETYIVRMARAYVRSGHKVSVWVIKHHYDVELLGMLKEVAEVTFITSPIMAYPMWISSPPLPKTADLVFTTGRMSLLFAAYAAARAARPVRLVAGVFSQWEYSTDDRNPKSRIAANIIDQLGSTNMVFCTEGCRRDHACYLGPAYAHSLVSPLLIELPNPRTWRLRQPHQPFEIVSVSRLVNFKTSNLQMPGILKKLAESGRNVRWTLYGEGPERPKIEAAIREAGVESQATLAGTIPYSQLYDVLANADLYIGGGTTLIEASALYVPSLVALDENTEPTSPGFFADREGEYTSDKSGDERLTDFTALIMKAIELDKYQYRQLQDRSHCRAVCYSDKRAHEEIQKIILAAKPIEIKIPARYQIQYLIGTGRELLEQHNIVKKGMRGKADTFLRRR